MKFLNLSLYATLLLLLLNGCGAKGSSTSSSEDDGTTRPPVGTVSNEGMAIYIVTDPADENNELYSSNISKSTAFADPCFIEATASSQDITCYADFPELDVYMNGISYNYNIPEGMCAYLGVDTAYHYNYEAGVGPDTIAVTVDRDASNVVLSVTCQTSESGVDGPDPINVCNNHPELTFDDEGNFTCKYDHSDEDGPNCCFGTYNLTITSQENGVTTDVETQSNVDWGGDYSACLGRVEPAGWPTTRSGLPRRRLTYAKNGLNELLTISAPIQVFNTGSNLMVTNRYTAALHSHTGYYNTRISTQPYAIDPIDDRNGTDLVNHIARGRDSFDFLCLDESYEIINRIRVIGREWNTYKQFQVFLEALGASGDPDVASSEPCDGVGIEDECNDFLDWDDIGNYYTGYPTNPATDLNQRKYYFPRLAE